MSFLRLKNNTTPRHLGNHFMKNIKCHAVFGSLGLFLITSMTACLNSNHFGDKRIVKIASYECQTDNPPFIGTGLLFQNAAQTYVLTSDHVVLHANDDYCHEIRNDAFGAQKAHFIAADWGNGLSLLEVPEIPPLVEFPSLLELKGTESEAMDRVQVPGFPADSDTLISDNPGQVIDPLKERKLFALLPHIIELSGAHGEFGMSGGPVFHENGSFLGVLSHQVLVPNDSLEDSESELTPETLSPENHLLVIPAKSVFEWLTEYFTDPLSFRVSFHQLAEAQRLSWLQFYSGHLFFLARCSQQGSCEIDIERMAVAQGQTKSYSDPHGHLKRIEEALAAQPQIYHVSVRTFREGNAFQQPITQNINSPIDFFRKLEDATLKPMAVASTNHFSDKQKMVKEAANEALSLYRQIHEVYDSNPPKTVAPLLSVLVKLESLFESEWYFSQQDIQAILLDENYGWTELTKKAPQLASKIKDMFRELGRRVHLIYL